MWCTLGENPKRLWESSQQRSHTLLSSMPGTLPARSYTLNIHSLVPRDKALWSVWFCGADRAWTGRPTVWLEEAQVSTGWGGEERLSTELCLQKNSTPQDTLQSHWTWVPPAFRAETRLDTSPDQRRARLLGQLDASIQQKAGSATEKNITTGTRHCPGSGWQDTIISQRAAMSRGGAHVPSAQQTEDRGQELGTCRTHESPSPRHGQGTMKLKSVLTASGVMGFSTGQRKQHQQRPRPCPCRQAQVSTTRMRGMGLGLGGLDILTLPGFSTLARV